QLEIVVSDQFPLCLPDLPVPFQIHRSACGTADLLKCFRLPGEIIEIWIGQILRPWIPRIGCVQQIQMLRIGYGRRVEEYGVDEREDGGVCANSQCERE